jgi:hypothetical protein
MDDSYRGCVKNVQLCPSNTHFPYEISVVFFFGVLRCIVVI